MKVYRVGGAVRDFVIGKESNDLDFVVVGSSPEEMLALGFKNVGKSFPVFLHPETGDEYALARKEKRTGKSYTDFVCETENVTLEQDLKRRDLRLNALAMDSEENIIDPFGGLEDIKNKVLRHIDNEAFKEDAVRVLRVARFSASLGFSISEETKVLIKEMRDLGELDSLSGDRINLELNKVFNLPNPARFFEALMEMEVFENLFPWVKDFSSFIERIKELSDKSYTQKLSLIGLLPVERKDLLFAALFLNEPKEVIKLWGEKLRLKNEQMSLCLSAMNLQTFLSQGKGEEVLLKAIESAKPFRTNIFLNQISRILLSLKFEKELISLLWKIKEEFDKTDWEAISKKASKPSDIAKLVREERLNIISKF